MQTETFLPTRDEWVKAQERLQALEAALRYAVDSGSGWRELAMSLVEAHDPEKVIDRAVFVPGEWRCSRCGFRRRREMKRLTQQELSEPDVELIVSSQNIDEVLYGEVSALLSFYIPREQKDGSWKYVIPAYLARQIDAIGRRLSSGEGGRP